MAVRVKGRKAHTRRSKTGIVRVGAAKSFTRKGKAAALKAGKRGVAKRGTKGKAFTPQRNATKTLSKGPVRKTKTQRRTERAATARKFVKTPTKSTSKTKSHSKAGLHRIGRTGNRYSDATGKVFHRNAKGTFSQGEPGKKKKAASKKKRSARPASRRRRGGRNK